MIFMCTDTTLWSYAEMLASEINDYLQSEWMLHENRQNSLNNM